MLIASRVVTRPTVSPTWRIGSGDEDPAVLAGQLALGRVHEERLALVGLDSCGLAVLQAREWRGARLLARGDDDPALLEHLDEDLVRVAGSQGLGIGAGFELRGQLVRAHAQVGEDRFGQRSFQERHEGDAPEEEHDADDRDRRHRQPAAH